MSNKRFKSFDLAITAILLALVVILQCLLGSLPIGAVSLTFVLIPIVLGAIAVNKNVGAFLGFCFGLITYIMGLTGADAFTYTLISYHPALTAVVCIVKGTAAGYAAGLTFELFKRKSTVINEDGTVTVNAKREYLGVFVSAMVAPTVNTGLFIIGALFMSNALVSAGLTNDVMYFLFIQCAGLNYIIEVALNVVFVPSLYRVYKAVKRK